MKINKNLLTLLLITCGAAQMLKAPDELSDLQEPLLSKNERFNSVSDFNKNKPWIPPLRLSAARDDASNQNISPENASFSSDNDPTKPLINRSFDNISSSDLSSLGDKTDSNPDQDPDQFELSSFKRAAKVTGPRAKWKAFWQSDADALTEYLSKSALQANDPRLKNEPFVMSTIATLPTKARAKLFTDVTKNEIANLPPPVSIFDIQKT